MAITYGMMANVQSKAGAMGIEMKSPVGSLLGGKIGKLGAGIGGKDRVGSMAKSLMPIAEAALAIGPGRGTGLSASSALGGKGSIFKTSV